ncbi:MULTISPECIES: CPBP family intramembrane glutamic endopeptidase [unclassified Rhodococcus (in: high G+C Gram-positive bacteria)]|uniref:CPBP family intramembrane glutamic endopeptidase n=1 Tax=unclassified Rhodococcus (in: high G+C Gram-positive bacteria) TaxID=192944 RepID=UPI00163B0490|nr:MULTISPECIES: CPBP family intramembrane glutamic endopeptidase [unclassified Rhodococcus (in: high G+C Gram-positive bacteria)]MBC2641384.1 CPBP family intramembrane metalloprotease [Rhodococcus sp. 3A]MBC2893871.1 CPBP family intramembrane metalloprotease [Rhodococcus sp. 4CII]
MISRATLTSWIRPAPPEPAAPPVTGSERRALWIEITIVLLITFGASGLSGLLSLSESLLTPGPLADQSVALNVSRAENQVIDVARQLLGVVRLFAWAALGLYLLWRSGLGPSRVGLGRFRRRPDATQGLGLAALVGLPGLGLYLVARALGANLTVVPSTIGDHWWRLPALILWAIANSGAEEVLVVAYLITRLRQLGWSENSSLLASAVLRGTYHLYQGFGGGLGNVAMGLVFGRYWQKTGRLWPLVIAHATIDSVAFVGYAALRGHVGWIP